MKVFTRMLAILAITVWAGAANATIIFDNIDLFKSTGTIVRTNEISYQFTATGTGTATSLAANLLRFGSPTITFNLYNDTAGTKGTLIESVLLNAPNTGPQVSEVRTEALSGVNTFIAGTNYWVGAVSGGPGTFDGVGWIGVLNNYGIRIDSSSPVPAPATLALFGLGLAGLGWSRRKQHS
ncbi:PEP-CTERM sorting domain-containing protein [Candidatus Litorirhabdus singularis]|uniref:PEP-CTERM sorting domain-containing protein n=1 Tax=Candidatus Litorirhabdus singularis TaxID=2518993 RepID=UPI00243044D1|nr:PEP-CTERM sorting domain-containing protein [Candidatus Litorirhabdus singularis]